MKSTDPSTCWGYLSETPSEKKKVCCNCATKYQNWPLCATFGNGLTHGYYERACDCCKNRAPQIAAAAQKEKAKNSSADQTDTALNSEFARGPGAAIALAVIPCLFCTIL